MPFADEQGVLIKDPWGQRPVVTCAVPGVPVEHMARAAVSWLETCRRDAVTMSAKGTMIAVHKGQTTEEVCAAFARARSQREAPLPSPPESSEKLPARSEGPDFWDITRQVVAARL
ncbi:MAG TPA: hypothetical protein PKX87_04275 [Alphaproteobacteria bacterium]|nr:hypothetical protein [Alphaproteobacteria bacterium]